MKVFFDLKMNVSYLLQKQKMFQILMKREEMEMMDLKDVEQFLVWKYLNQKERDYLIKKYDIKSFQRLRELENESILVSMNNLED